MIDYAQWIRDNVECRPYNSDGVDDGKQSYLSLERVHELVEIILKEEASQQTVEAAKCPSCSNGKLEQIIKRCSWCGFETDPLPLN